MKFYTSILLAFFLLFSVNVVNGQTKKFTQQEIREDLDYLHAQLLETHPIISIYHTKKEFQDFFAKIEIPNEVTENEAYQILASTSSIIKDGHTLFYPSAKRIDYNKEHLLFFPFSIFWDGTNLFVRNNFSNINDDIEGLAIQSINGIKSTELIGDMLSKMMRDGDNLNYPIWVLNKYFFEYYSFFYGCPNEFDLNLKTESGDSKDFKVKAIPRAELLKKTNALKTGNEKAIFLALDHKNSTAVLTIKDWHNNILKKVYQQSFKKEIKNSFAQIEKSQIKNLIIDLRNNQGGNLQNSKLLLSHLLNTSFELLEGYQKVQGGKLTNAKGPHLGLNDPQKIVYNGSLFVLINGGSFSNTGIFCSVLRKHNRALFIGEETGGSAFLICGNPKTKSLPNTKIQFHLPSRQFNIKDYSTSTPTGIIPDHVIKPTITSLINGHDLQKEFAMDLIKGGN